MPEEEKEAPPAANNSEVVEVASEDVPVLSPPDSASALKIGIFGAFSALVTFVGISALMSPDRAVTWAAIVIPIVGIGGLIFSWLAWRSGGFEKVRKLRAVDVVSSTFTRIVAWLHSLGRLIITIATVFAFIKVMTIISGQPNPDPDEIMSKVAWYGLLIGFALTVATSGRKEATALGRMTALRESLNSGKSAIDATFAGLADAHAQLESVRKDIQRRSRALEDKMNENAKLAKALGTDPDKVKEFMEVQRRSNGLNIIVTVVMTLVGFVLGLIATAAHWDEFIGPLIGINS